MSYTVSSTYTSCEMSSEDIVNTHDTFINSLAIELSDDDKKYLTYIRPPCCIISSETSFHCWFQYCSIKTSHTGVNNMCIFKISTNLLSSLAHLEYCQ